jgi:hypothetical protein
VVAEDLDIISELIEAVSGKGLGSRRFAGAPRIRDHESVITAEPTQVLEILGVGPGSSGETYDQHAFTDSPVRHGSTVGAIREERILKWHWPSFSRS